MSFEKINFIPNQTEPTAEFINNLQDEVINKFKIIDIDFSDYNYDYYNIINSNYLDNYKTVGTYLIRYFSNKSNFELKFFHILIITDDSSKIYQNLQSFEDGIVKFYVRSLKMDTNQWTEWKENS